MMENKNLAPHEPVVREGGPTPSNATAEPATALTPNHLYPTHYDLLERGGRRMVDFIRVDIAGQKVTSLADGSQVEPITTGAGRHIPLESPPFIQWNGGENPAPGKRVDVKFRVGECGMDGEAAG